jgi:DNA adenine methylase
VPVTEPRPFLKWAGGKRQLLPQLRRFYPDDFRTYYEPFLGSGAVFFDLWQRGKLRHRRVVLTDDNADLIGCYLRVRDRTSEVLAALERLAQGHERHQREHYYRVRDEAFNPARRVWRKASGAASAYTAELAAMLIYLNRTGYNGLFRLNAAGEFNVPVGRYERPRIVDSLGLEAVAEALATPAIHIRECRFEDVLDEPTDGDFVYLDPPYAPLSRTSQFRSYTARRFEDVDQERLSDTVVALATRSVYVMLSNSTAASVTKLYEQNGRARQASLVTYRLPARRAINSRAASRGAIDELLVTNLSHHEPSDRPL